MLASKPGINTNARSAYRRTSNQSSARADIHAFSKLFSIQSAQYIAACFSLTKNTSSENSGKSKGLPAYATKPLSVSAPGSNSAKVFRNIQNFPWGTKAIGLRREKAP